MIKNQTVIGTKLSQVPQHSYVEFPGESDKPIFFNSKFDSGNLSKVTKSGYDHYSIWTAVDAQGTPNQGYPKSWFYFQVGGFRKRKITFSVYRVHFLWAMVNKKQFYRPVYRVNQQQDTVSQNKYSRKWHRLPYPILSLSVNNEQQLVLKFDFYFPDNVKSVQFAFTYPYSHQQCRKQITSLDQSYQNDKDLFFKQYQLCKSYQGRVIDMIIISSHQGKQGYENIKMDQFFKFTQSKLVKFRSNKPIILISARVHPIQTPSSYTMTGIINFLLSKNDYQAHLLRKYFVFVLVPMLNPDGVSNGHCRMDALNQNLNRYYKNPDPIKQPSCYSIMKLSQHYNKDKRLFMYLDLHAHPANKGNFIFGNAIFDYIDQVQSQLFPKFLSQNCINFQFQQCIFSRKHMKAKDRNEDMNKQGCGRVAFYKQYGLTHSYTLQCGYHCNSYNNVLETEANTNKNYICRYLTNSKNQKIFDNFQEQLPDKDQQFMNSYLMELKQKSDKKGGRNYQYIYFTYHKDQLNDSNSEHYKNQIALFNQQIYYNLGRNICRSILDIWSKNPFSRIRNADEQRKQIADKQSKLDRFRKQQAGIKTKQKKIIQLIQSQCYGQWLKRNIFQFTLTDYQLNKSTNQLRNWQKSKSNSGRTQSLSFSLGQKIETKLNAKLRQSLLKQQQPKMQTKQQTKVKIIQPHIQSIKTIKILDQSQMALNLKLNQLNLQKSNFKPLINVRIRNVSLVNNR